MHPIVYNCCLRSLAFLPQKVQAGEKPFKVKVFNKHFNDQEDTFQSITEYIYADWLTELRIRTIELTDPLKDKIYRLPDWLANQSSFNLIHDSLYSSENKRVQVLQHFGFSRHVALK